MWPNGDQGARWHRDAAASAPRSTAVAAGRHSPEKSPRGRNEKTPWTKCFSISRGLLLTTFWLLSTTAVCPGETDPIKIGFLGDFSDVTRQYCRSAYQAAQMAVDEMNARGGLLGRPVVLIQRDAGIDPTAHADQFIALAREEKVVAVFGGASSPCILKASQAAREQRIPYLISVGNTQAVLVEEGHDFVFLFEPNSWMETRGFSIFTTLMPWRRYAWIGPDYSWGREAARVKIVVA